MLSLCSVYGVETVSNRRTSSGKIYQQGYLTPEEAQQSIQLQDGYSLQLVLSDPDVSEPVAMAWDGNGALYVVEMRTYMQDADATGERDSISRISRHEDVDGDGIYEKHSVFVDDLFLPRFVLPLDDRILVGLTNTKDLWTYRDTDGDGVADEKLKVHEGGSRGGNMEHQASGMLWNMDNWLYCTYEPERYRFVGGKIEVESLSKGQGQWGLAKDNVGRIYYSDAGGENPAFSFQQPIIYGALNLSPDRQEEKDFRTVYPISSVPDVQGGERRLNSKNGLNHFTGCGGQSIYRGDRLPAELQGDLFLPEPVGRLIRRAKVVRRNGLTRLGNAHRRDEFIRAKDVNFRPLWTATSPDGAMMMIDMHRGIIQQGNWTRPGSYLRGVIDEWGLDKNINKGRIYRLEHTTYQPDKKPRMLDETTAELVAHLSHPNGWWRDTAQKLIILREDGSSVVPALEELAKSGSEELGRLHALWTLEGLSQVTPEILQSALADSSSDVRCAAIRLSEPFLAANDVAAGDQILRSPALATDIEMQLQLLNSVAYSATSHAKVVTYSQKLRASKASHPVVKGLTQLHQTIADARKAAEELRLRDAVFAESMSKGKIAYEQLCFACHGADGLGSPMPGVPGQFLAPSFVDNPRVVNSEHAAIRTLLHGLTGDLDGKKYEGVMAGMGSNSDQWIADVTTYIRNSFGNEAPQTKPEVVTALRDQHKGRKEPWTQEELEALQPAPLSSKGWKLNASHNKRDLKAAIDGDSQTRYSTKARQQKGMWVQIQLPKKATLSELNLDYKGSNKDGPQHYAVSLSQDGRSWSQPVATGSAGVDQVSISFPPQEARFVKIELTHATTKLSWSIHELQLIGLD